MLSRFCLSPLRLPLCLCLCLCLFLIASLTHSPTHSLTHPLTHSLTHPPTRQLTHSGTTHANFKWHSPLPPAQSTKHRRHRRRHRGKNRHRTQRSILTYVFGKLLWWRNTTSDDGHALVEQRRRQLWQQRRPGLHGKKSCFKDAVRRTLSLFGMHEIASGTLLLVLIGTLLSIIALGVCAGLFLRPIFSTTMLFCATASLIFVATEHRASLVVHQSLEAENRFWGIVIGIFVSGVMFAPDSPLPIGLSYPRIGTAVVSLVVIYVHHRDRNTSRQMLMRIPRLQRTKTFHVIDRDQARNNVKLLNQLLQIVDVSTAAQKLFYSRSISEAELNILELLRSMPRDQLNYAISNSDIALILYKVKDRDLMRISSSHGRRTAILKLMCEDRLEELTVGAKATLIDALQRLRLTAHPNAPQWVAQILKHTAGSELTRLKTVVDNKGTANNMHKLIFRDIADDTMRADILAHFQHQADLWREAHERFLRFAPDEQPLRKILSDVDDTLLSSGGMYPAGCDRRLPRHVLYPGVLALYRELDLGPQVHGEWKQGVPGNLAFLSARPHVYKDVSEKKTYKKFDMLMRTRNLHAMPTLLAGSLHSGLEMFRGDFGPMARKKYTNFAEFAQIYPECNFVWMCDNGQGDVMAAELMHEHVGSRLEVAYVHRVQAVERTPGYDDDALERWKSKNIVLVNTYLEAALDAFHRRLISIEGLQRIATQAREELQVIFEKHSFVPTDEELRRWEFNSDLAAVNKCLQEHKQHTVPPIEAKCLFEPGSHVSTGYGGGVVVRHRPLDGIYEVQLYWPSTGRNPVMAYLPGARLMPQVKGEPGTRVCTTIGTGELLHVRPDGMHVVEIRRLQGEVTEMAYLRARSILYVLQAATGDTVLTSVGRGVVVAVRLPERIYVVRLKWGVGFFPEHRIRLVDEDLDQSRSNCAIQ
jgi:Phosphatidate phosphatase APP1, catalytic domain